MKKKKNSKLLFGSLKGKMKPLTTKERDEMWRDENRGI